MAKLNPLKRLIQRFRSSKLVDPEPLCNHIWKSFPMYLDQEENYCYSLYDVDTLYSYELIAPYVCTKCGKAKYRVLSNGSTTSYSIFENRVNQILIQGDDQIKSKLLVMKMIYDEQMKCAS